MDEETTAHTGGLMVTRVDVLLGQRKGGGETAVGCAKMDRAELECSGGQQFTSPPQTSGGVGQGSWFPSWWKRKNRARRGGDHRWRQASVAQPQGTRRVECLGQGAQHKGKR